MGQFWSPKRGGLTVRRASLVIRNVQCPDLTPYLQEFVDSALFWLDQIRNTNSYFVPFADFIYTCIPAVTRYTHSDTIKLDRSISKASKFIEKYSGSILAEEMEFKLAWWLFRKDSTSTEFYDHAKKVIEKYPKNINSFGIRKHIPSGL